MIVTLTPNPSLDRTLTIASLQRGTVHRADAVRVDPGGKGVNVSRALAAHGLNSVAVLPLGGAEGRRMIDLLTDLGITVHGVPIAQEIRTNITLAEPDGVTTKLNEPGPLLTEQELRSLALAVLELADEQSWVVGSGSLPCGADPAFYAMLMLRLRARGARVVIDSSGEALAAALEPNRYGVLPDLIKPNREELAELVGKPLQTLGDVVTAAQTVCERGVPAVLASLGADGAVLVSTEGTLYGQARIDTAVSTVGAGDAALAGYLHAAEQGGSMRERLAAALAWGTAATGLPGSRMPTPDDVRAVNVTIHDHVDHYHRLEGNLS